MKRFLMAAAAAGVLALSASAASADDFFSNTSMNSPITVHITQTGENVYMAPMDFTGVNGSGDPVDYLLWCLDIYHNITLGNQSPPLDYSTGNLTTSTSLNGNPTFSLSQIGQFSHLINEVAPVYIAANDYTHLDYIQGALWDIGFGAGTVTADATTMAGISSFITGQTSNKPLTYFESTGQTPGVQDFVKGGVPEPAAWALMLVGFGGLGAAMRRRRAQAAFA